MCSGVWEAKDLREERSQAVASGWSPPFVTLASLEVQKQKSGGKSGGDIWTVSSRILASRDESEGHSRKTEQSE